jgi:phage antirepressor YoqD-like protein
MQDLISNNPTMSTREIAMLVASSHDSVLKTVRDLISRGVVSGNEATYEHPQNKQIYPMFNLSKRDSLVVASGYSVELRARIIDRWQELENKQPENPLLQLANAVLTAQKVIDDQSNRLAIAEPKAVAFDLISEAEGELCLTDAAKHLQIKPSLFIKWLQVNGWIFKRAGSKSWAAYQNRIDQGLLVHKRAAYIRSNGDEDFSWQVLVTPKGISVLAKKQTIQEFRAK